MDGYGYDHYPLLHRNVSSVFASLISTSNSNEEIAIVGQRGANKLGKTVPSFDSVYSFRVYDVVVFGEM